MFSGLRLASIALVAFALSADALHIRRDAGPIKLPFVRRMNTTGISKLLQMDQARAKALKVRGNKNPGVFQHDAIFEVPATNQVVEFVTTVSSLVSTSKYLGL